MELLVHRDAKSLAGGEMIAWGEVRRPKPQSMEERLRRALWVMTACAVLLAAAVVGLLVSCLRG